MSKGDRIKRERRSKKSKGYERKDLKATRTPKRLSDRSKYDAKGKKKAGEE